MAINPVETALPQMISQTLAKVSIPAAPKNTFGQVINSVIQEKSTTPASRAEAANAAAELMRLEMLKNALSLDGDNNGTMSQGMAPSVNIVIANLLKERQITDSQATAVEIPVASAADIPRPDRSATLDDIIGKASRQYGVDVALIKAVIKAESNFNTKAVSHAGAQGLMQLMPGTARGLGVTDSFDPEQNIMAGTRFLKDMLKRYRGDLDSALAAYNWGPGNIDRKGTGSLPKETREYLARVKSNYHQFIG